MKEQYVDTDITRRLSTITFVAASDAEISDDAFVRVSSSLLYEVSNGERRPARFGVLDHRMGTSEKERQCDTCNRSVSDCVGHFGFAELTLPCFHVGYIRCVAQLCSMLCRECARVRLTSEQRDRIARLVRGASRASFMQRREIRKRIAALCRKNAECPFCGARNVPVRRVGMLKLAADSYKAALKDIDVDNADAETLRHFAALVKKRDTQVEYRDALSTLRKCGEVITAADCLALFDRVAESELEYLIMSSGGGYSLRPGNLVLSRVPVAPLCVRPSVPESDGSGSTEDPLTMSVQRIVESNEQLRAHIGSASRLSQALEHADYLQLNSALLFNSDVPAHVPPAFRHAAPLASKQKGLVQRLKGKHGRFRGNLSGKRVDFSSRSVISPDPNLRLNEVGVPEYVARILTYTERVTVANRSKIAALVRNGPETHPGANYVEQAALTGGDRRIMLRYANRAHVATQLRVGDRVERHLCDGDVVLFNRQPSLHRLSIQAFRVRVLPGRTFRFNEAVCTPFNADFDGDEMNVHVPQTEEARAEAAILMDARENMSSPRNGEPLIAPIQDFITGSYLLTRKDTFFSRAEFNRISAALITDHSRLAVRNSWSIDELRMRVRMPPPAVVKPVELWTGKQLFSLTLRPASAETAIGRVNLRARTRECTRPRGDKDEELCANDGFVLIRAGELLAGCVDKTIVGSSSKANVYYTISNDFGSQAALDAAYRLCRVIPEFLSHRGLSIGVGDVATSSTLLKQRVKLVRDGYAKCEQLIASFNEGRLQLQAGMTAELTLESAISRELSEIRERGAKLCLEQLDRLYNSPLIMALCGSKGSSLNVSQMVACVGQQIVSGHRIPDGFEHRSLPHFARGSKEPAAKGFVANSFYSGLNATEFYFHTMAGREGLIDTAVKTAETGYMQRRLMKCLEDLCAQYDGTVRNSVGELFEFSFGGDSLDPLRVETATSANELLDLLRVFDHVRASNTDPTGLPLRTLADFHAVVRAFLERKTAEPLNYSTAGYRHFIQNWKWNEDGSVVDTKASDEMKGIVGRLDCAFLDRLKVFLGNVIKRAIAVRRRIERLQLTDGARSTYEQVDRVTGRQLDAFLAVCFERFDRAHVEPGSALGALCAQSIGEPSTQMTLKTFHFAGVASMNITLGVPRIKEIINAVKSLNTPIIRAPLVHSLRDAALFAANGGEIGSEEEYARVVKARVERTRLAEVCSCVEETVEQDCAFLRIFLNHDRLRLLKLLDSVTVFSVANAIRNAEARVRKRVAHITVEPKDWSLTIVPDANSADGGDAHAALRLLRDELLANVIVCGLPQVNRALISKKEGGQNAMERPPRFKYLSTVETPSSHELLCEGYNLRGVMATAGVDGTRTSSNSTLETLSVLGIEAAYTTIIREIRYTMQSHGISLDERHVSLLASLMTRSGSVCGVTRHGLIKTRDSVLMLASFERTADILFEAASFGQSDTLDGVSECIIIGAQTHLGTGCFKLLHRTGGTGRTLPRRSLLFDSDGRE